VAPEKERVFTLAVVDPDGTVRQAEEHGVGSVTEMFAPGQFREMADEEKLTAPAFEPMQAGIRFGTSGYVCGRAVLEPEITYARETILRPARTATATDGAGAAVAPPPPDEAAGLRRTDLP